MVLVSGPEIKLATCPEFNPAFELDRWEPHQTLDMKRARVRSLKMKTFIDLPVGSLQA